MGEAFESLQPFSDHFAEHLSNYVMDQAYRYCHSVYADHYECDFYGRLGPNGANNNHESHDKDRLGTRSPEGQFLKRKF